MSNQITVFFFATIKEKTGVSQITLKIPENYRVKDLRKDIEYQFPSVEPVIKMALFAVNREYSDSEDTIPLGAEIAIFPPVSGGNTNLIYPTICKVISQDIKVESLTQDIILPSTGAICSFTGIVRAVTERGEVHTTEFLEYEAYTAMAEAKMQQIAQEIRKRWSTIEGIVIVQRLGKVAPGIATVFIACSAAHRDTGIFEATHYGIDRLKEIVPVWKRETGADGEVWIEGDYYPKPGE
jgi:molybdopterin synthase catalytic subunit